MEPRPKKYEKSKIEAHLRQKKQYSDSLKANIQNLSQENHMEAFAIYEKIRDVVPDSMISNKIGIFMHQCLEKEEEFIDPVYAPTMENLEPLKRKGMEFISWFRIKNFFKDGNFCLFNDIRMRSQMLRDRGFSYLCDALNSLSTQPGLVIRLFEYTETNFQGIYSIWVNFNGIWKEVLIDDYIPIYSNKKGGKAQFYFASPNQEKREVWAILLQKALARAYCGFHNLYNGNTTYILRDLTGAPVINHNLVYISEKQKITGREEKHMASTWRKIVKNLTKGYVLTFIPRAPNKVEVNRNGYLKVFNKKMFLGNGIYSGHNYAVVSARAVRNSKGGESRIVQLRNPWMNEEWDGDFGQNSDLWTEELKKELNYNPAKNGRGQFWIPVKDIMNYFEHLQICKAIPGYSYNAIKLKFPQKNFGRAVVRFHVPKKGKYTLSLDQQDTRYFKHPKHTYSGIKLTLCKLENGQFQLLSHTSSACLRNTFIRKLIDEGEYYILIEQKNSDINKKIHQEVIASGDEKEIGKVKHWRHAVFSLYGPSTCGIKIIECEDIHVIHDYLIYEGWKQYGKERIGNKLTDFKLTFDDGHKGNLSIYLISVPKMIIYAFKNDNDYGVDINTEIMGITNMEIVGPEGKVGFNQHFKIDANDHDVFILRETEDRESAKGTETNGNSTFKLKSIVGTRYGGQKEVSRNQSKVYDFLYFDKPTTGGCMVEKFPQLKMASLFDSDGNRITKDSEDKEIKVRVKSVVEAIKAEDHPDNPKEFVIEEEEVKKAQNQQQQQQQPPQQQPQPVQNVQKQENIVERVASSSKKPPKQPQNRNSGHKEEPVARRDQIQRGNVENMEERRKSQLKFKNEDQVFDKNSRISMPASQEESHKKRPKSILKKRQPSRDIQPQNNQVNHQIEQDEISHKETLMMIEKKKKDAERLEKVKRERKSKTKLDDSRLAHLLSLSKDEILMIDNDELLKLIKYTGIDAFVNLYQADHDYLERLYSKLGSSDNNKKKEQQAAPAQPQYVEPHQQPPQQRESYGNQQQQRASYGNQGQQRGSYNQPPPQQQQVRRESYQNPDNTQSQQNMTIEEKNNFNNKDFSMVGKRNQKGYKKVSRPSFLDRPKQQETNRSDQDYHKIEVEYNNSAVDNSIRNKTKSTRGSYSVNNHAAAIRNPINAQQFILSPSRFHNQTSNAYLDPSIQTVNPQGVYEQIGKDYADIPIQGQNGNSVYQNHDPVYGSPKKQVVREAYPLYADQPQQRAVPNRRSYGLHQNGGQYGQGQGQQQPQQNDAVIDLRLEEFDPNYTSNYTNYASNNAHHYQVVDDHKYIETEQAEPVYYQEDVRTEKNWRGAGRAPKQQRDPYSQPQDGYYQDREHHGLNRAQTMKGYHQQAVYHPQEQQQPQRGYNRQYSINDRYYKGQQPPQNHQFPEQQYYEDDHNRGQNAPRTVNAMNLEINEPFESKMFGGQVPDMKNVAHDNYYATSKPSRYDKRTYQSPGGEAAMNRTGDYSMNYGSQITLEDQSPYYKNLQNQQNSNSHNEEFSTPLHNKKERRSLSRNNSILHQNHFTKSHSKKNITDRITTIRDRLASRERESAKKKKNSKNQKFEETPYYQGGPKRGRRRENSGSFLSRGDDQNLYREKLSLQANIADEGSLLKRGFRPSREGGLRRNRSRKSYGNGF